MNGRLRHGERIVDRDIWLRYHTSDANTIRAVAAPIAIAIAILRACKIGDATANDHEVLVMHHLERLGLGMAIAKKRSPYIC